MNIKNRFSAIFIAALLGSTMLSTAQAQDVNQSSQSQAEMVSGGIGDGGMDAITAKQNGYSLKLVFAEPNGEYLSDVSVVIQDKKRDTVLDTSSVGPILLVKLKAGTYTVSSSNDRETKTSKVIVNASGLKTYYVHLNESDS